MPCYILKHCFWQKTQNKAFRPALCAFLDKLEVWPRGTLRVPRRILAWLRWHTTHRQAQDRPQTNAKAGDNACRVACFAAFMAWKGTFPSQTCPQNGSWEQRPIFQLLLHLLAENGIKNYFQQLKGGFETDCRWQQAKKRNFITILVTFYYICDKQV